MTTITPNLLAGIRAAAERNISGGYVTPCSLDPRSVIDLVAALEMAQSDLDAAAKAYGLVVAERDALRVESEKLRKALDLVDPDMMGGEGDRARAISAPEDAAVDAICKRIGYGAVMDAAARLWFRVDPVGAFVTGPCAGMVRQARAALKETPHGS